MPPKKQHALASRVKRIMQSDEDVGKIAQATPVLIGEPPRLSSRPAPATAAAPRQLTPQPHFPTQQHLPPPPPLNSPARAMELFLQQLCDNSARVARERGAKTVASGHL